MGLKGAVFAPLQDPEYSCAASLIVQAGLEPSDFVLEERCTHVSLPGGGKRTYKLISVKQRYIGFQRQYNCGPGGGWPYEFQRDLLRGLYGRRGDRVATRIADIEGVEQPG